MKLQWSKNNNLLFGDQQEIFEHPVGHVGLFCLTQTGDAEVLFPVDVFAFADEPERGLLIDDLGRAFAFRTRLLEMDRPRIAVDRAVNRQRLDPPVREQDDPVQSEFVIAGQRGGNGFLLVFDALGVGVMPEPFGVEFADQSAVGGRDLPDLIFRIEPFELGDQIAFFSTVWSRAVRRAFRFCRYTRHCRRPSVRCGRNLPDPEAG